MLSFSDYTDVSPRNYYKTGNCTDHVYLRLPIYPCSNYNNKVTPVCCNFLYFPLLLLSSPFPAPRSPFCINRSRIIMVNQYRASASTSKTPYSSISILAVLLGILHFSLCSCVFVQLFPARRYYFLIFNFDLPASTVKGAVERFLSTIVARICGNFHQKRRKKKQSLIPFGINLRTKLRRIRQGKK